MFNRSDSVSMAQPNVVSVNFDSPISFDLDSKNAKIQLHQTVLSSENTIEKSRKLPSFLDAILTI